MSADPITYCLERLSDYRDFERFCSALLVGAGYLGLDPLGGTGDEGRDAIIRSDESGRKICFAYSVRSDWRDKLRIDCRRMHDMGHSPDVLVFVSTQALAATEKDFAHSFVRDKYGWTLDLFDLERIRVEIVGAQRHLIAQHPSIFTPPFFPQRGGQSIAESRDTLLIDHVEADHAVAAWLSRRLSLQGFRTWCHGTAPLAGEDADESVHRLLAARAVQYLPVVSPASIGDSRFLERCTLAAAHPSFVLPCSFIVFPDARTPSRLAKLTPAYFDDSWKIGLDQVLTQLASLGIQSSNDADRSRQIALRDYLPCQVTVAKDEPVFANAFPLRLPRSVFIYDLPRPLTEVETLALRRRWAFVSLNTTELAAFVPPPADAIPAAPATRTPEYLWADVAFKEGKRSFDIVKELVWRGLEVICARRGLEFCMHRKVYYFPRRDSKEWTQLIRHVDGRSTTVQLSGERTKGWGDRASPFLYQLAPRFRPMIESDGTSTVLVNMYVRVTDLSGVPFEGKEIGRRRKIVGKSWWNKQWLTRLIGIVQALETSDGVIQIGEESRAVVMETRPLEWKCPIGLNTEVLAGIADIGAEIAAYRAVEDELDAEVSLGSEGTS